jgi:hypothetical protein
MERPTYGREVDWLDYGVMNVIPVEELADNRPVAILIRHAERHPIVDWQRVHEPLLTEKGKRDSLEFGRALVGLSPVEIYHSPSERCRQTAEGIHQGILKRDGASRLASHLPVLAGETIIPGKWSDVVKIVSEHGWPYFCRKWFDGELPGDLAIPLERAAYVEIEFLAEQLQSRKSSKINVTHDFLITVLREYFFGIRHEDVGIPEPLDAIAVYLSQIGIHLRYHEHERILNWPVK